MNSKTEAIQYFVCIPAMQWEHDILSPFFDQHTMDISFDFVFPCGHVGLDFADLKAFPLAKRLISALERDFRGNHDLFAGV